MGIDWDSLRFTLASMARRRDQRINQWTRECPSEWNPTQVINPETDIPFSDSSAWLFIAELLECNQCVFDEVPLRHPPGTIGYEALVVIQPNCPKLYIKIQLMSGKILGRSFHYSLRG